MFMSRFRDYGIGFSYEKMKTPNAGAHMDPVKMICGKIIFSLKIQVGSMRSPCGALFSASFWRFSDTVYPFLLAYGKVVISSCVF